MSTPNTLRHFVGYFFRDTANKLLLAFTGFYLLVFVPIMVAFDYFGTKHTYGHIPLYHLGAWRDALLFGLIFIPIWIGVIIYRVIQYRKYLNKNL